MGTPCQFAFHNSLEQTQLGVAHLATAAKSNQTAYTRLTSLLAQNADGTAAHEEATYAVGSVVQHAVSTFQAKQAAPSVAGLAVASGGFVAALLAMLENPQELETIITNIMSVLTLFGL